MGQPVSEIERERKYELAPGATMPSFDGAIRAAGPPVERRLDATYYDTTGWALAAAGITLRHRVGGKDAGWHLKLPLGPDAREELRLPLGSDTTTVPGELTRLLRAYTLEGELRPMARLKTVRVEQELTDAAGRVVANVTDDQVTGQAGAEPPEHWRELEAELAIDAPAELLDELETTLVAAGARGSAWSSKLRRLVGDRVPAVDPAVAALRQADVGVRRGAEGAVVRLGRAVDTLRESIVDEGVHAELGWLAGELEPGGVTRTLESDRYLALLRQLDEVVTRAG